MPVSLTSEQVWREIDRQLFAVLGTVNAAGKPRTSGIVYKVKNRKFYILVSTDSVKARNVTEHPHASLTIAIAKRIPFMPWVRIPAATITVHGQAKCYAPTGSDADMVKALTGGLSLSESDLDQLSLIEVLPEGNFVTYGVGVPLAQMSKPKQAMGKVSVT